MTSGQQATAGGVDAPPPAQVAGFTILSEIGRGGMGIVYRASDAKLGREVALKRPKPELMARRDFASRFLREARTASRLLHPNVTTVFAAFEEDGVPWLAMELVDGGSLRQRLREGPLPVAEIVVHAEGLADALRAAHENGILHADINPNNILIGRDGRARLTDFGLARARNAPGEPPVFTGSDIPSWSTPDAAGTRGYMAPEHVRTGRIDERSDIYCLGLVLFEMCTGQSVFGGKNTVEWVGAVVEGKADRLTKLGRETATPPELARIIGKATATKATNRYQTAAAMVGDLRLLRRYSESGVEMAVVDAAVARKRTLYGTLAAAGILALAGTYALVRYEAKHPLALRSRPLTSAPGWEGDPALSPDGAMVAYASDESGNDDIWLMDVATRSAMRLTDDPATDRHPAWFPDGKSLAFASARGGEPGIWAMGTSGGKPRLLLARAEDPAISPDGTRIAFATRDPSGTLRIAVAPLSDPSAMKVLTSASDGAFDQRDPSWSPDSRRICYQDLRDLWIVPAAGGSAQMLTDHQAASRYPTWSSDGRFVYFSSTREGPLALWRISSTGGAPERVTMGTGPEVQPTLSRDGQRMAYATQREDQDVEVRDRRSAKSWRLASSAFDGFPAVEPRGRGVAFSSTRSGSTDLWWQSLDAGGPEGPPRRLTDLPGTLAVPEFSPDGRWIAFHRVLNGERDIWVIPSQGGSPTNLTDRAGLDMHPAFSPDGSALAFVSDRQGGQHVWIAGFADGRLKGEPRQVTAGDGIDVGPSWAPDGHQLVFVRQSGGDSDAMITGLDSGSAPRRLTRGFLVQWVRWGSDGATIFVEAGWDKRHVEVREVAVATGSERPEEPPVVLGEAPLAGLFDLSTNDNILAFDVASVTGDVWIAEGLAGGR